jgi:hypothetical protein
MNDVSGHTTPHRARKTRGWTRYRVKVEVDDDIRIRFAVGDSGPLLQLRRLRSCCFNLREGGSGAQPPVNERPGHDNSRHTDLSTRPTLLEAVSYIGRVATLLGPRVCAHRLHTRWQPDDGDPEVSLRNGKADLLDAGLAPMTDVLARLAGSLADR